MKSTEANVAKAPQLEVWCARAIKTVLAEVGAEFERSSGHKLNVTTDAGLQDAYVKRMQSGERFDVFIFPPGLVDQLIQEGRLAADTRKVVARSGAGVAVRAGAPKPDVSSVAALKQALMAAKSIAYLKVGLSGVQVAAMLERIGMSEAIRSKVVRPQCDIVSQLVAKGEVELGLVVTTQILTTPGVDLAGELPAELQSYVAFVAAVSADSQAPQAARELIRFLTGPSAVRVIKMQGMQPGAGASK